MSLIIKYPINPCERLKPDVSGVEGGISERRIWSQDGPIRFEDSLPVLKSWLEECETSEHTLCKHEPQPLPKRVLYLKDGGVELIEPGNQIDRYAALSHCWGDPKEVSCTTQNSFPQFLKLDQLSQNFQDAVRVTRALGMKYLWIDSLCIIQGDEQDWQSQSSKMAEVYGNASVTIAATAASHSRQGFLFERKPAKRLVGQVWGPDETAYYARMVSSESTLLSAPLSKRGWVLQEMVLSKRVVHFARDQLFWRCRTSMKSEDGFIDQNQSDRSTFWNLDSVESARRSWWSRAEDYSSRQLTKEKDKYPALAGLTTAFRDKTKLTPKAGLWEEEIHFGLLWCSLKANFDGSGAFASTGPSWSWLSVNRPIRTLIPGNAGRWKDQHEHTTKAASITAVTVDWSGDELVSSVRGGRIEMLARIKPIHVSPRRITAMNPYPHLGDSANVYWLYWKLPHDLRQPPQVPWIGMGVFDGDKGPASGSSVLCLELSIYGPCSGVGVDVNTCREYDHCRRDVLLVKPKAGGLENEYERIGAGSTLVYLGSNRTIHPEEDYFYDVVPKDIVLL